MPIKGEDKEEIFFDNFEEICALMTEAAKNLRAMLENGHPYAEAALRIKALENQADELTHGSIEKLHKTFVTPLDRQDILRLIVGLDDILDTTEAAASLLNLYHPRKTMGEAEHLAGLLVRGTDKVAEGVSLSIFFGPGLVRIKRIYFVAKNWVLPLSEL